MPKPEPNGIQGMVPASVILAGPVTTATLITSGAAGTSSTVATPTSSNFNSINVSGSNGTPRGLVGVVPSMSGDGQGPGPGPAIIQQQGTDTSVPELPQKKFPCHLCKRSFMHKQSLDIHMRSHTGERPYSCTDCGQSFSQRATLNRHRRRVHLPKSQQCTECGRKFGCRDYLIKHIRTHTGELPYTCVKCGKRFRDKSALNQHSRSHK